MKTNVLAIRVDTNVYTRHNDDAEMAGLIVAMISNLVKLRKEFASECVGLINHYNFVEIPNVTFYTKILKSLCGFLGVEESYITGLLEVCYLPVAE